MRHQPKRQVLATAVAIAISASLLGAQTRVRPPKNSYSVQQDVELGREAASQAREQLPIMRDDEVTSYVEHLGDRLVDATRPDLRHRGFRYTFDVINVRDLNAFALPGGPLFINRGMIEAARNEGELAGVLAHEISHIALRHGTAQASKARNFQFGQIAGAVLGAIVGGRAGDVISYGAQFGLGTVFLKFGREYERHADIEGAQLMARAGYDPRDMANMFRTIEKRAGPGGPEWLSDHPNPGNRYEYITKEAATLRVENAIRATRAFERVQAHLQSLPPAPTTEQATRNARRGGSSRQGRRVAAGPVDPPSSRYKQYNEGDIFRVSVPSNWRELPGANAVTFAPDGAYGHLNGQSVFTHGVEIGISRNETHDLRTATDELIDSLSDGNPRLTRPSGYRQASLGGRRGLQVTLGNVSEATGERETIQLVTTLTGDGHLMYLIAVAPQDEFREYQPAFQRVAGSIRLMN